MKSVAADTLAPMSLQAREGSFTPYDNMALDFPHGDKVVKAAFGCPIK